MLDDQRARLEWVVWVDERSAGAASLLARPTAVHARRLLQYETHATRTGGAVGVTLAEEVVEARRAGADGDGGVRGEVLVRF